MSDKKQAMAQRVYEYHDGEGNVYWSLYKAQNILSSPTRLKLRNRVGVHFIYFLMQLRHIAEAQAQAQAQAEVGRVVPRWKPPDPEKT